MFKHQTIENVSQTCSVYICNMNHTCTSCQPARLFIIYIVVSGLYSLHPPSPPPNKGFLKLTHKIRVVQCMIIIADCVLINWRIEQSLRTRTITYFDFSFQLLLSFIIRLIRSTSTGTGDPPWFPSSDINISGIS